MPEQYHGFPIELDPTVPEGTMYVDLMWPEPERSIICALAEVPELGVNRLEQLLDHPGGYPVSEALAHLERTGRLFRRPDAFMVGLTPLGREDAGRRGRARQYAARVETP